MKRRVVLKTFTVATLAPLASCHQPAYALSPTASDVEGPYYPTVPIPLDAKLLLDDGYAGDALDFSGRVLSTDGQPLAEAKVEIWQCDANSVYRHPRAPDQQRADAAFRGFGAALADASGRFNFHTIVPVPYPGRPPHIHATVWVNRQRRLTTQVYLRGHSGPEHLKIAPERSGGNDVFQASFDFVIKPV